MFIELTRGFQAQVDGGDYARLSQFNWWVSFGGRQPNPKPYAARVLLKEGHNGTLQMHREILKAGPGQEVDHINGDTLDNRRKNLRIVTRQQNAYNYPKPRHGKTSRFKGVSWSKDKARWRAVYQNRGRQHFIGYFSSQESAARAYDAAVIEVFGVFANTNFQL